MKEVKHFVCDFCQTEYADKASAKRCEENHKQPCSIGKCRYIRYANNEKGYPISVEILFSDGSTAVYKRG